MSLHNIVKYAICTIVPFLIALFVINESNCAKKRALEKIGIRIEWQYNGVSAGDYGSVVVWYVDSDNYIRSPITFGGIKEPHLNYRDLNGDGIDEIIFSGEEGRQVLSFNPKTKSFTILENHVN